MRSSAVRVWQDVDLLAELEARGVFSVLGSRRSGPQPWEPTVEQYLTCRHSQRSFALPAMGEDAASAFDAELRQTLTELCADGALACSSDTLRLSVETSVVWGRPRALR